MPTVLPKPKPSKQQRLTQRSPAAPSGVQALDWKWMKQVVLRVESCRQQSRSWIWQRCSFTSCTQNLVNPKQIRLSQLAESVVMGHAGLLLTWSA
jgi:hypothetical protein